MDPHSFYPGFAFRKTARSRSAKNECGTTDLILANSFLKTEPKIERERVGRRFSPCFRWLMIPSLWNLLKLPGCCCHYLLFCQVLSPHEREKLSSPTFFSYTKEFTSLDGGNFCITWSYGLNLLHHGREFCCVRRELSSFFFLLATN